jgi:hypothetical protein
MFKSLYPTLAIFFMIIIYLVNMPIVTAASSSNDSNLRAGKQSWNRRPRQFRMQVYSRPDAKGAVQTLRTSNGGKFI